MVCECRWGGITGWRQWGVCCCLNVTASSPFALLIDRYVPRGECLEKSLQCLWVVCRSRSLLIQLLPKLYRRTGRAWEGTGGRGTQSTPLSGRQIRLIWSLLAQSKHQQHKKSVEIGHQFGWRRGFFAGGRVFFNKAQEQVTKKLAHASMKKHARRKALHKKKVNDKQMAICSEERWWDVWY